MFYLLNYFGPWPVHKPDGVCTYSLRRWDVWLVNTETQQASQIYSISYIQEIPCTSAFSDCKNQTQCSEKNEAEYRQHMIREMKERGLNVTLFNTSQFLESGELPDIFWDNNVYFFVFVSSQLKFLLNTTKCRSSWYNIEQARPVADDSAETFLSLQASVNDAHITTIYSWFSHTPANHNCAEIVTNWTSYRSVDDSYVSRPIKIFKNCSFITYQNRTLVITEDPLKSDCLKNVTYISTLKNSSRPPLKHITLAMPPSGGIHAQSLWDELFLTRQQVLTDSEEEVYPLPTPIPIFSPNDTRNGSTTRQRKKRTSQNSRLQPDLVRKTF